MTRTSILFGLALAASSISGFAQQTPVIINNNIVNNPAPQPQVVYAQPAPQVVYTQPAPQVVYQQAPQQVIVQAPAPQVIYQQAPAPVVVQQPAQQVVYTQAPQPPTSKPWDWITSVWGHYNNHDSSWITSFTQNYHTNYFGHTKASNAAIQQDMYNDSLQYGKWNATWYPETFTHDVSNEYSSHWNGPMIYDSITIESHILENGVRWHNATVRFTVGYTYNDGVAKIYALVEKVL
jgi:hypothetical protein